MLILHVSDLHITAHGETLETVWNGPKPVLPDGRFDFVIVSGDLSQRASEAEYRDLVDFARDHLVRLLKVKQRERVIFVPGNHDVNWESPIGTDAPFHEHVATEKISDARRFLAGAPARARPRGRKARDRS